MIFNSIEFLAFFVLFFTIYWLLKSRPGVQNVFLLVASYVFYGYADWRYLSLLVAYSGINYYLGLAIDASGSERRQQWLLRSGVILSVGLLITFKYLNFFIQNFIDLFNAMGMKVNDYSLHIMLPLGISFYVFRTLSYLLDIYYRKMKPTRDWVSFFAFVSFFPEILSGPIDRARVLLPQIEQKRVFDYDLAVDGMRQILWGLFKKIAIADNCAPVVNTIFNNYEHQSAGTLLLGAFSYAFQLYADFSGYSDMAIGIGKLMGFRLMNNFSYPFFALNISQFWRKWHISLTSWLTDYVYTPLSIRLRDWDKTGLAISIITTFTLVGMWHGAKWNWIWFGVLHSLMFIPLILKGNAFKGGLAVSKGRLWPTLPDAFRMLGTFCIVMLLFVVFRADTLGQAIDYIRRLFSFSLFSGALPFSRKELVYLGLIVIMMAVEWVQREKQHGLVLDRVGRPFVRLVIYYAIIGAILLFGNFSASSFIYFKF